MPPRFLPWLMDRRQYSREDKQGWKRQEVAFHFGHAEAEMPEEPQVGLLSRQ